jgi:hypothetical protein
MKTFMKFILFFVLVSFPAFSQQPTLRDTLLDCMAGKWVLRGKIAGKETVHDIKSDWVLNHQYVLIKETSREKNIADQPEYEANVYVGWDDSTKEYSCIWIDIWGGVTPQSIGRAKPDGNKIAFLFRNKDGKIDFHTTFIYNKNDDIWLWLMDNDDNGKPVPFARMKLTRE